MERIFSSDVLTKRERVERTLLCQPVDRVAMCDGILNPGVVAHYIDREIEGFDYTVEELGRAVSRVFDLCMPITGPKGTDRVTLDDGCVVQYENWMRWIVSRPFDTPEGARDWLLARTDEILQAPFDPDEEREEYRRYMSRLQNLVGETVIMYFSQTGLQYVFRAMGIDLFVYFYEDYPQVFSDYIQACVDREERRIHAIADFDLTPVIMIPEDFATKQGPMFSPEFLWKEHFVHVARLTKAWHEHGIKVILHTDGNYRKVIPDLIECGVDGFFCLEPSLSMNIVEFKKTWPEMIWMNGVDGVDLMERGTPQQVRAEVRRHIVETDALRTSGMFVGSSSEINPPIPPENFVALVDAVGGLRNPDFRAKERTCPSSLS